MQTTLLLRCSVALYSSGEPTCLSNGFVLAGTDAVIPVAIAVAAAAVLSAKFMLYTRPKCVR